MKGTSPRLFLLILLPAVILMVLAPRFCSGQAFTLTRLADGFDYPVGKPDSYGYYVYRGFTQNGHLGEDWNGNGGGNTDLGDAVYSIANGVVVFSQDYKKGWGNVTIIRHAYRGKSGQILFVDSLYGHLHVRMTKVGERVTRGQKIGTIGRGPHNMYAAHLHFEIRQDLRVGMHRSMYPQTYQTYTVGGPRTFLKAHRVLRYESRMVRVPINTFQKKTNPNRAYTQDISVPKLSEDEEGSPSIPETTSSVISRETEPEATTPAATRSMLKRLLGRD
ncbi:MAG: M23 family metallopeptidase [Verrucomicrobiales bacterium]|nr:M23 family metallopeptidase [Verrucomicrobiales bacterium]